MSAASGDSASATRATRSTSPSSSPPSPTRPTDPAGRTDPARRPSAARARTVEVAAELIAARGVGGTSLQMIADDLGVTKAAVYHQYRTKDAIVLAVAEAELARVRDVVEAAESEADPARAREVLLDGIVELAVQRGRQMSGVLGDPVVVGFFADHDGFRSTMDRLRRLAVGGDGAHGRVRTAMLVAAVSGAVMHPFVAELDEATLRSELGRLARAFLDAEAE